MKTSCPNKNETSLQQPQQPFSLSSLEQRMRNQLTQRKQNHSIRSLDLLSPKTPSSLAVGSNREIDFCSNDYLGLAHSVAQHEMVECTYKHYTSQCPPPYTYLGSTGSRLLSGNSALCVELEEFLATVHGRPAALVCNSGYDANLSLLSCLPLAQDVVILDELCHNSLIMGVHMSRIQKGNGRDHIWYFSHNDVRHLQQLLDKAQKHVQNSSSSSTGSSSRSSTGSIFVVVESVYSMDGDIARLEQILDLSWQYDAHVIVDEAHGLGVYGRTNPPLGGDGGSCSSDDGSNRMSTTTKTTTTTNTTTTTTNTTNTNITTTCGGTGVLAALGLEQHPALLAGVFTFGKAAGCHGAVITGSCILKEYLVNYARPFIYSTSLPPHSLIAIQCAYHTLLGTEGEKKRNKVFHLVRLFCSEMMHGLKYNRGDDESIITLLPSPSPIQAVMCRHGNDHCIRLARRLRHQGGIAVFAIRSPTVPKGQERIRIILHAHNTEEQVMHLVNCLLQFTFVEEELEQEGEECGGGGGLASHSSHEPRVLTRSKL